MSKRKSRFIISVISLLFADIVYFIWLPYPKSLLGVFTSNRLIPNLLSSIIYYAIFSVFILVGFSIVADKRIEKKKLIQASIKLFLSLIVITLTLDVIKMFSVNTLNYYSIIVSDLCTVAQNVIIGCILVHIVIEKPQQKQYGLKTNAKGKAVASIIFVLVFILFTFLSLKNIGESQNIAEKYSFGSSEFITSIQNINFIYSVRNFLLDYLSGCYVFVIMFLSVKTESDSKKVAFPKCLVRIFLSLFVSFALCGIKILVIPHTSIANTNISSSEGSHNSGQNSFSFDSHIHQVSRSTGYGTSESVFCETKGEIWYSDERLYSFVADGSLKGMSYQIQGNTMIMNDIFEHMTIDGKEINICYDKAIVFETDSGAQCIPFSEIKSHENNPFLISVCEALLQEGRIDCFEYVSDYLNTYDYDFLQAYCKRYVNAEFTENESAHMNGLNPSYIISMAKTYIKEQNTF